MAFTVKLRTRATKDIGEAFEWYEEKRTGLGEEFLLCVDDAILMIQQNPKLFEEKYPQISKCNLRKFPSSIYYRIYKKQVAILAVYHQSRNPRRWRKRKK